MVASPKTICTGCHRALIPTGTGGKCDACKAAAPPRERKKADPFYSSQAWRTLRARKLQDQPLCECADCERTGAVVPATTVDHRIERSERPDLELDYSNLVSMSHAHHNRKTARERHRRNREGK